VSGDTETTSSGSDMDDRAMGAVEAGAVAQVKMSMWESEI
jgi:hypothetical protein